MKKLSLLTMCLMFGGAKADNIQNPIWYSISEKILAEAQEFIAPLSEQKIKKAKPKTTAKPALRCVEKKKDVVFPNPEIMLPTNGF